MKKIFLISFLIFLLILIFIQIIYPLLQEKIIITNLKNSWNVTLDLEDKLILFKKNKAAWHGDQQKFALIESTNPTKLSNHREYKDNKMNSNIMKRIIEIEDILEIETKNRISFTSAYDYKIYTYQIPRGGSDQKIDWLYYVSIKEENKLKIFLIEDLSVLDLGVPRF